MPGRRRRAAPAASGGRRRCCGSVTPAAGTARRPRGQSEGGDLARLHARSLNPPSPPPQAMLWKGGRAPPPTPPGHPAYAQPLSPEREVPASLAFVTDSNRPQPLWQPPPTACLTASEVPSLLMHPCPPPPPLPSRADLCPRVHGVQVALVREFMSSLRSGKSLVKQMIMGAGKTTVVSPLLALMLADGDGLVMEVVPSPLLEFSRSVLRKIFSSVMHKRIYTFIFDRASEPGVSHVRKLQSAIQHGYACGGGDLWGALGCV